MSGERSFREIQTLALPYYQADSDDERYFDFIYEKGANCSAVPNPDILHFHFSGEGMCYFYSSKWI